MRLKCIDSRALAFVRKFIVPLPAEATLLQKFGFMHLSPGFLLPAFEYLKDKVSGMIENENLVTLSFDEMKIDERSDYDYKLDAQLGPHSYAQQLFVRSLIGKWKLPIFTEFDVAMSKETLISIIQQLEEINVHVLLVICDQGTPNQSLSKQLGITTEKVYFEIEGIQRKIFFAPDVVHLVKSLR